MTDLDLCPFSTNATYSDVKLILTDGTDSISINAHRIILAAASEYFQKLFHNFREKDAKEILIEVPNSHASYDLITSFYGCKPDVTDHEWQYHLNMILCRHFFGMSIDINKLCQLTVPAENFDLLLDTMSVVGLNDQMLQRIIKYIPIDYNFDDLAIELRTSLLDYIRNKSRSYLIVITAKHIMMMDQSTNTQHISSFSPGQPLLAASYNSYHGTISLAIMNNKDETWIKFYDIVTHTYIASVCYDHYLSHPIHHMKFFAHGKKLLLGNSQHHLCILCTITYTVLGSFTIGDHIEACTVHPTKDQFVTLNADYTVSIWNLETCSLITQFSVCDASGARQCCNGKPHRYWISYFHSDQIVTTYPTVCLWDSTTGKLIKQTGRKNIHGVIKTNNKTLCTLIQDKRSVYAVDLNDNAEPQCVVSHMSTICHCYKNWHENQVVVVDQANHVIVWDLTSQTVKYRVIVDNNCLRTSTSDGDDSSDVVQHIIKYAWFTRPYDWLWKKLTKTT